jgi:probable HAF family extracellular repeat protein
MFARIFRLSLLLCYLTAAASAATPESVPPSNLKFSPVGGSGNLLPRGISPGAGIVGSLCCQIGSDAYSLNTLGFVLTNQPYPNLVMTPPNGQGTGYAAGINSNLNVVGQYCLAAACHGFFMVLDYADGYFPFNPVDFPGALATTANGINTSGTIVGSYCVHTSYCDLVFFDHGFMDNNGAFTTIDFSGASTTAINGINDAGDMVGGYSAGGPFHGWLRRGGVFTTIDLPGAKYSAAEGINKAGVVVGTYIDAANHTHGFKYAGGVYTTIDHPQASITTADGIDDQGEIVGTYSPANSPVVSYIGYIAR